MPLGSLNSNKPMPGSAEASASATASSRKRRRIGISSIAAIVGFGAMLLGNVTRTVVVHQRMEEAPAVAVRQAGVENCEDAIGTEIVREGALNSSKQSSSLSSSRLAATHYCQHTGAWSTEPYWDGTVSSHGCGLCSYTSIVNILNGTSYSPQEVNDMRGKIGGGWNGMDAILDDNTGTGSLSHKDVSKQKFGLDSYMIPNSVEKLREELKNGNSAAQVLSRGTVYHNANGEWRTSNGHFICVYRADSNGFYVQDSAYTTPNIFYTDSEMEKMLNAPDSVAVIYRTDKARSGGSEAASEGDNPFIPILSHSAVENAATDVESAFNRAYMANLNTMRSHIGTSGYAKPANPGSMKDGSKYQSSGNDIGMVECYVLHDSGSTEGAEATLQRLRNDGKSIHFLIDRNGIIWKSVPIDKVANHATPVNSSSIGIMLCHEESQGYTEAQLGALDKLIAYLDLEISGLAPKKSGKCYKEDDPTCGEQMARIGLEAALSAIGNNNGGVEDYNADIAANSIDNLTFWDGCFHRIWEPDGAGSGDEDMWEPFPHSDPGEWGYKYAEDYWEWLDKLNNDPEFKNDDFLHSSANRNGHPSGGAFWRCCSPFPAGLLGDIHYEQEFPVNIADTYGGGQVDYAIQHPELYDVIDVDPNLSWDEQCLPGDILCWINHHTMMYVGNELAQEYFPGTTGNFLESGQGSKRYLGVTKAGGYSPADYDPSPRVKTGVFDGGTVNGGWKIVRVNSCEGGNDYIPESLKNKANGIFGSLGTDAITSGAQTILSVYQQVPGSRNMCLAWVNNVFDRIGQPRTRYYNPREICNTQGQNFTSNLGDIKPGMIVLVPSSSSGSEAGATHGHIGIYVGNGEVVHNGARVEQISLESWCDIYGKYTTPRWGWLDGKPIE